MINVERAEVYFLKPVGDTEYVSDQEYTKEQLEANPDLKEDNALVVGSKHVLNQVAVYMTDDDIMATTGINEERCVILTFLSYERCKEIIELGQKAFDKRAALILSKYDKHKN